MKKFRDVFPRAAGAAPPPPEQIQLNIAQTNVQTILRYAAIIAADPSAILNDLLALSILTVNAEFLRQQFVAALFAQQEAAANAAPPSNGRRDPVETVEQTAEERLEENRRIARGEKLAERPVESIPDPDPPIEGSSEDADPGPVPDGEGDPS